MTRTHPFDETITTSAAFERTLAELVRAAHENGVTVSGAWECRTDAHTPDWEAVITELVTRDETDAVGTTSR